MEMHVEQRTGYAGQRLPRECLAACLMTDAERYTALSEEMQPSALVEMINRYFDALFGPVLSNGGMISDVKGDGLLAVWNYDSAGPDFRTRVCAACVEIIDRVDALNSRYPAHRMPTRLGVDFGPVAIARVGAHERYEYRAVGDPVNTAHRLEELNKALKTRIVVSAALAQGVTGFLFRDLGSFHLRGKKAWTRVCELMGTVEDCDERDYELCRDFARALEAYSEGSEEAVHRFRSVQSRFPEDGAARYYLQRIEHEQRSDPAAVAGTRARRSGWLDHLWRSGRTLAQRAK